jgi:hypothetical protein
MGGNNERYTRYHFPSPHSHDSKMLGTKAVAPTRMPKSMRPWDGNGTVFDAGVDRSFGWYTSAEVGGKTEKTGYMKWAMGVAHDTDDMRYATKAIPDIMPATPVLLAATNGLAHELTEKNGVVSLHHGEVVDIILQNTRALDGKSEHHPWHLHGHSFWVLGHGVGVWNASSRTELNTVNPPLMDTVTLYPFGWTVIRFVADNPGVHAMHCHIDWHVEMGMGVFFAEAIDKIPRMPKGTPLCGKVHYDKSKRSSSSSAGSNGTAVR